MSKAKVQVLLQEFIELVKKGNRLEAVKHAKKFLSTEDAEHLPIVQQGMALLAFPLDTVLQPYKDLLDTARLPFSPVLSSCFVSASSSQNIYFLLKLKTLLDFIVQHVDGYLRSVA